MNPQRNPIRPQQQLSAEQIQKQREFLMQQQKLRLMASTNTQKVVSADTLIENLLSKKETFKLSDPLPPSTFATTSAEKCAQPPRIQQAQYDSRQPTKQQVAVEWLSPLSPNFPEIYRKVFSMVGEPDGMVDTGKIFPLLLTSGLSTDVLGYIWGLVNRCVAGKLTENELYAVLALVALAQKGYSFNSANVLTLVPQPPIPNLNLGTEPQLPPKASRGDLNLQSPAPSIVLSKPSIPPTATPEPNSSSNLIKSTIQPMFDPPSAPAEDFDDFADFQSASSPPQPSKPRPLPPPDPMSLPEPVFVQKFPVVSTGGRSIGSRLANHTLGAAKPANHATGAAKPANHAMGAAKPANHAARPRHKHHTPRSLPPALSPIDDDFSDFQQAVTASTAPVRPQGTQKALKESAIRQAEIAKPTQQDSSPKQKPPSPDFEPAATGSPPAEEGVALASPSHPPKLRELMGVEEDRYGALRALSLFAQDASDLGESEATAADESFADIAARPAPAELNHALPGTAAPAAFDVDDWGLFETAGVGGATATEVGGGLDWRPSAAGDLAGLLTDLDVGAVATPLAAAPVFAAGLLGSLNIKLPGGSLPAPASLPRCLADDEDDFGDFVSPNAWTDSVEAAEVTLGNLAWSDESVAANTAIANLSWGDGNDSSVEQPRSAWRDDGKEADAPSALWLDASSEPSWPEVGPGKPDNPVVSQLWLEEGKAADSQSVSSLELPGLEHAWDAVGEWRRCLQSCLAILQFAVDAFDALSDSAVLTEVLGSARAQAYLRDLVEVWCICERIATSYHKTGLDQKIDALLNSTTTMWSLLKPHYSQAKIPVESEMSSSGPDMCSVCLAAGAGVTFEGHSYHAPCANLWLNNIDTALPALHQP